MLSDRKSRLFPASPQKMTPAKVSLPGVRTEGVVAPWPVGRYHGARPSLSFLIFSTPPKSGSWSRSLTRSAGQGARANGARALVGACLVKNLYAIPTWTRTARLIAEHAALQDAIGGAPSEWACYRFTVKLRAQAPLLDATL